MDFVPYLMFLPIWLLGLFFGYIYRYFAFSNQSRFLGIAIATAILFPTLQAFATSNVKIVGGTVTVCLIMFAFNRVVGAKVMVWLSGTQPVTRRSGYVIRSISRLPQSGD